VYGHCCTREVNHLEMFSLTKWWVCILLGVILVTSVMHHVLQKVSILTKNKEQEH
ncbi:hypothetical protein NDU88_012481, partial [Pleurodeles waltl]